MIMSSIKTHKRKPKSIMLVFRSILVLLLFGGFAILSTVERFGYNLRIYNYYKTIVTDSVVLIPIFFILPLLLIFMTRIINSKYLDVDIGNRKLFSHAFIDCIPLTLSVTFQFLISISFSHSDVDKIYACVVYNLSWAIGFAITIFWISRALLFARIAAAFSESFHFVYTGLCYAAYINIFTFSSISFENDVSEVIAHSTLCTLLVIFTGIVLGLLWLLLGKKINSCIKLCRVVYCKLICSFAQSLLNNKRINLNGDK